MTDSLPEGDYQAVVFDPVASRQNLAQGGLGLVGGPGRDQSPSIGNPMHVRVNADPRLTKRFRHDEVRGLAPDTFEREEIVDFVWHATVEAFHQVAANFANATRLGAIKADRVDQLLDFLRLHREYLDRSPRFREQPRRSNRGGPVVGAQTQDTADESKEGVVLLGGHQRE